MEKPKEVSSTIHILQMTQNFWEIETCPNSHKSNFKNSFYV